MKNNNGNNRSKNNHRTNRKHSARQPRYRNHAVLVRRTALSTPSAKSLDRKIKSVFQETARKLNGEQIAEPRQTDINRSETNFTGVKDQSSAESSTTRSEKVNRWYNNPRITGSIAAILLFATLAIAVIPTSLNVRAEEQFSIRQCSSPKNTFMPDRECSPLKITS